MERIKLFDGKNWGVDEILKQMDDDSFYYGYLGQNALSSSSAKDYTSHQRHTSIKQKKLIQTLLL